MDDVEVQIHKDASPLLSVQIAVMLSNNENNNVKA